MDKPLDKYSVFWYNEQEINHWSDAEFEAKAAEFAAAGVNIVMTFSSTHFRWSFYPYWEKINAAIGRIVKACHKYNIRVVEHHSSHLQFNPQNAKDWDDLEVEMQIRHSSMTMFPDLKNTIAMLDPEIAPGVRLSHCRQIDGRTNDYARTVYAGYGLCFNNPHYRKRYFEYLESLYKLGVDGIMTDDVQYYGAGNTCTCKFCREKFTQETGFELPPPEDWGKFAGNHSDKIYTAFLQFRIRSTAEFQKAVSSHAASLGYKLLRPNYTTTTFSRNLTAYAFESASELWSCMFQENMFSAVIRQSWVNWSVDAVHRLAMAQRNNVMAMSMFYPDRYDNYYFSWALARAWNHLLMATPEGSNINDVEQEFLQFDLQHPILKNPQQFADAAFLQPRSSLDYAADAVESAMRPFMVWTQAGLFRNLKMQIIFEDEPLESWQQYPFIVLAGATMLSDELLLQLRKYVNNGGRLFIFGAFGIYQTDGSRRAHPEKVFDIKADLSDYHSVAAGEFRWQDKIIKLPPTAESRTLSGISSGNCRIIAQSDQGEILGISCLNDQVIWLAGGIQSRQPDASHYCYCIPRWTREPDKRMPAPPYAAGRLRKTPGSILEALLVNQPILTCSDKNYLTTLHIGDGSKSVILHLVNTSDTLAVLPATVSHADKFAYFQRKAAASNPEIILTVQLPGKWSICQKIQAFSPEFTGGIELSGQINGNKMEIKIPAKTFSGYLMIQISNATIE